MPRYAFLLTRFRGKIDSDFHGLRQGTVPDSSISIMRSVIWSYTLLRAALGDNLRDEFDRDMVFFIPQKIIVRAGMEAKPPRHWINNGVWLKPFECLCRRDRWNSPKTDCRRWPRVLTCGESWVGHNSGRRLPGD